MKADIERARDTATVELRRLQGATTTRPALPPLDTVLARIGGWQDALARVDVAHQREILGELIEGVEPIRTERQTGKGTPFGHDVKIDWTPSGDALRELAGAAAVVAT